MKYEEPKITVIYLETQDVIATSTPKQEGEIPYEDKIG